MPLFRVPAYLAGLLRKRAVRELFRATADAFGCEMPSLRGLSPDEALREYALFTAHHAEQALRAGQNLDKLCKRLYNNAYALGARYRRRLHIHSLAGAMRTARWLYRLIGIDFAGSREGQVIVRRCFFSAYYSAGVCGLMAAMDNGLLAGLSGGGELVFETRLTEGAPACEAQFRLQGEDQ